MSVAEGRMIMNGSGCKNCPVKPCETMNYRGSTCSAQRARLGLGDPMTIADRIRAMSDEELGIFLGEWAEKPWAWKRDGEGECLAWLKQPAEEEKTVTEGHR